MEELVAAVVAAALTVKARDSAPHCMSVKTIFRLSPAGRGRAAVIGHIMTQNSEAAARQLRLHTLLLSSDL